jgi:hypothetical protein
MTYKVLMNTHEIHDFEADKFEVSGDGVVYFMTNDKVCAVVSRQSWVWVKPDVEA